MNVHMNYKKYAEHLFLKNPIFQSFSQNIFFHFKRLFLKNLFSTLFCTIFKHLNGKYQRNKHLKQNLLFFHDVINIKNFNASLLKLDKNSYKNIDVYFIGYITKNM